MPKSKPIKVSVKVKDKLDELMERWGCSDYNGVVRLLLDKCGEKVNGGN